jgi:hypothetical protein
MITEKERKDTKKKKKKRENLFIPSAKNKKKS